MDTLNWGHLLPFVFVLGGALLTLLLDVFCGRAKSRALTPSVAILACALSLYSLFAGMQLDGSDPGSDIVQSLYQVENAVVIPTPPENPEDQQLYLPVLMLTQFSRGCVAVILIGAIALLLLSPRLGEQLNLPLGEYYSLFLLSVLGMMALATSVELLTMFISLEIASLAIYVLIGVERQNSRAGEASFKYFILGAFASSFFIFWAAFFYGYSRTTFLLVEVGNGSALQLPVYMIYLALAMILVALCFKMSIAPFHFYAADVYDGAPTTVSGLLATCMKVSIVCALAQITLELNDWATLQKPAMHAMATLAIASIVIGNLVALTQRRVKRLLAFSSVAHSGYILLGILALVYFVPQHSELVAEREALRASGQVAASLSNGSASTAQVTAAEVALNSALTPKQQMDLLDHQITRAAASIQSTQNAILIYLLAYTLMNIIGFGVVASLGPRFETNLNMFDGLAKSKPVLAFVMTIALISLTGLPPTLGFIGKFYVFAGVAQTPFLYAIVIAVLFSVISAFYYLHIVVRMYMSPQAAETKAESALGNEITLLFCMALLIVLGVAPMIAFSILRISV